MQEVYTMYSNLKLSRSRHINITDAQTILLYQPLPVLREH